ncbi:MAG: class I SAM-dependent methyltransferase [Actinomycetota bacterium]|nr:class I SAM-dependent methyltransferase [Actinomycetota bacterium]
MQAGALRPYEDSLQTSGALGLCADDGRVISLDVARWLAPVDAIDQTVLSRCAGPVLDVGCGPGRFVRALAEHGTAAMGVDIAETAVALTRGRGLPAVLRSVFAPIPGEGRWPTVLLMDGNIGIGGDPARLLERVRALLAPAGRLIVETHPDTHADEQLSVRFSRGGDSIGPTFAWAHVGLLPLVRYAGALGFGVPVAWTAGGRTFASLAR